MERVRNFAAGSAIAEVQRACEDLRRESNLGSQVRWRGAFCRACQAIHQNDVALKLSTASPNASFSACGVDHDILKIRPPLIFSRENVDLFVDVLDRALER